MTQRTDMLYRGIYATDASMYQILPLMVETPSDRDDVLRIVKRCATAALPMVARGAGTSLTGQAVNDAVIIDFSQHMNRVLELNLAEGWVRVEPGVVCSELNHYLTPHGVHFAPDPATENRASVGGMIANNSAGMRSVRYGMTINHVLALTVVLSDGEVVEMGHLDGAGLDRKCTESGREGQIYRTIRRLIATNATEIEARFPKVIRRSGGYALDALSDFDDFNLARLMCGSEGTLGIVLEAKLKLTPLPSYSALCLAHFASLDAALRAAPAIVRAGASAAELIDGVIVRQAREHPLTRDICQWIQGDPEAIVLIEVQGETSDTVQTCIRQISGDLSSVAYAAPVVTEAADIAELWLMRASALGLMSTVRGSRKPTPYIEDAAVPPEHLADYVAEVLEVCERHGQPVSLFGHASVGLVHIRPLHDLHRSTDIEEMKKIQAEVFPLVRKYRGSWSGEHGDGIVRGGYNREYFGAALYAAFESIKACFDPSGLMNPGKIVATPPMDSHLRYGPRYHPHEVRGRFRYQEPGGVLAQAERCTGVGACRKVRFGTMCPSYMATRDELHSTRGRANALRLALSGQLDDGAGLDNPHLAEAMELCLGCAGCKVECPNGVDMSRLKAEVLQEQHDRRGVSLRTRLFASMDGIGRVAVGKPARYINALLANRWVRELLERTLGIAKDRMLPRFTDQSLSRWFSSRVARNEGCPRVILFNDSYTEYFLPQVGRAVVTCLEASGYAVELATVGESQRVAISLGLLDTAKAKGRDMLLWLESLGAEDCPIIVCEPSSASALLHDLPDLVDDHDLAVRIAERVTTFDAFLAQGIEEGRIRLNWRHGDAPQFLVHNHCHQKLIDGGRHTQKLLAFVPGATVKDTAAGCCGMAGSFGYEAEHSALSRRIAEMRLIPALDASNPGAVIVTDGFSCRHQIRDLTTRQAVHVAEALMAFIH